MKIAMSENGRSVSVEADDELIKSSIAYSGMIERQVKVVTENFSHSHRVCSWSEDQDGDWNTVCDHLHSLNTGTPKQNHMQFCCYCGFPLEEVRWKEQVPA